ncbi:monovalent cation/H(+) antiporter subunit G [Mycobacterium sp. pW045]|uniref:monovalent cation/H(+) antiporter subunit G n=1 Tax=Mycobacterium sp. pW045 TaxID=3238984 RepID=UPI00351B2300
MTGWILAFTGVSVMVCCAVAAAVLPGVVDRLHLLSVTSSLGFPLTGLGLIVYRGATEASVMVAVIVALVVLTAPAMSAATARLTAQQAGVVKADSPP